MSKKPDPYASEEDTLALMRKGARTPAERELDRMLEDSGASEQGAEPFLILRQIALKLLAEQTAPRCQCPECKVVLHSSDCALHNEPAHPNGKCNCGAQRKTLTNDEILADQTLRYYFGLNGGAGPVSKQGRRIVSAIEAAHGIKEQP